MPTLDSFKTELHKIETGKIRHLEPWTPRKEGRLAVSPHSAEAIAKLWEDMQWIAGIPQNSIFDAPEVWGTVLETARSAVARLENA